jgi:hypothetical protein
LRAVLVHLLSRDHHQSQSCLCLHEEPLVWHSWLELHNAAMAWFSVVASLWKSESLQSDDDNVVGNLDGAPRFGDVCSFGG